jgi:hypothetical protein
MVNPMPATSKSGWSVQPSISCPEGWFIQSFTAYYQWIYFLGAPSVRKDKDGMPMQLHISGLFVSYKD